MVYMYGSGPLLEGGWRDPIGLFGWKVKGVIYDECKEDWPVELKIRHEVDVRNPRSQYPDGRVYSKHLDFDILFPGDMH